MPVNFVRKDIHVVLHYIGLRTGLNITVEGDISEEITYVPGRMTLEQFWLTLELEHDLIVTRTGNFVYVKRASGVSGPHRKQYIPPFLPVMPRPSEIGSQ